MIDPKKIAEWKEDVQETTAEAWPFEVRPLLRRLGRGVMALLSERDDLIGLLREIEWRGWTGVSEDPVTTAACPTCRARTRNGVDGHAPDCRLAAFLGT